MKKIGLTGGIGAGKTTVLKMFEALGAAVYIADQEAKRIMTENLLVVDKIKKLIGKSAYHNGQLNREYIAQEVFNNPDKLKDLNAIVHPAVRADFLEFCEQQDTDYIVYESALLLESSSTDFWDCIVLVTAPKEVRIDRVKNRSQMTTAQIEARIKNQLSDEASKEKASVVIENVVIEETELSVYELHKQFSAS